MQSKKLRCCAALLMALLCFKVAQHNTDIIWRKFLNFHQVWSCAWEENGICWNCDAAARADLKF